ncbi:MAG: enoyl-CoA hydratase/isomerase family protein [Planctomycetota bacterium]|nr:enoyl-CoA hydratase/isomerase family protein [Planctomycetota bacterium]MDA1105449.1 enoyl-CoA hydratase/isomerase family protein [Planctomycetota bacterium]
MGDTLHAPCLRVTGVGTRAVRVTLCRPESRNAMGLPFFDAFESVVESIERTGGPGSDLPRGQGRVAEHRHSDSTPTVLVIDAEGPAFCAGFDLGACAADPGLASKLVERLGDVTHRVRSLPCVVVASVQGPALAGGCALVAACDIVIASPSARFGYPVHRIGISPAVSLPILARSIGGGAARALALGGELVTGEAAHTLGLVHHLSIDDAALAADTAAVVEHVLGSGPNALRVTKRWLNELDATADPTTAGAATHASMATAMSDECQSMVAAFWARRGGR